MNVKTKLNAASEAVTTDLTINWEGMTPEDVQALAQQALIVKWQAKVRKDESGVIPATATVLATDYKVGTRAPKKTLLEQATAMSPEQLAAFIKQLQERVAG